MWFDPYEKLSQLISKHYPELPEESIKTCVGFLGWSYEPGDTISISENICDEHPKSFFTTDEQKQNVTKELDEYIEGARLYAQARITEAMANLKKLNIPPEVIVIPATWAHLFLSYNTGCLHIPISQPLTVFGCIVYGIDPGEPCIVAAGDKYGNKSVPIEGLEFTDYEINFHNQSKINEQLCNEARTGEEHRLAMLKKMDVIHDGWVENVHIENNEVSVNSVVHLKKSISKIKGYFNVRSQLGSNYRSE